MVIGDDDDGDGWISICFPYPLFQPVIMEMLKSNISHFKESHLSGRQKLESQWSPPMQGLVFMDEILVSLVIRARVVGLSLRCP